MTTILLGGTGNLSAQWKTTTADVNADGAPDLTIENDLLRITIGGMEGKLIALEDRLRGRQEAKVFPHGLKDGLHQLRMQGLGGDLKQRFELSSRDGPNGQMIAEARATLSFEADEVTIAPVVVTHRYVLDPDATRIKVQTQLHNQGRHPLPATLWIKQLLLGTAQPVAFMTPYGLWESQQPVPGLRAGFVSHNTHYLTSSNWISRSTDAEQAGNTLAMVTRPRQMFKVYTWRKVKEEYMTLESIFAPLAIPPGGTDEVTYYLTLSDRLPTPAYCSPLLNLQVDPHPTGIPAGTTRLTFKLAATRPLGELHGAGKLVRLDAAEEAQVFELRFPSAHPRAVAEAAAPVALAVGARYRMELQLTAAGKPLLPGLEIDDSDPIIIPFIVGEPTPVQVVYRDRTSRDGLFRRIVPREVRAHLAGDFPDLAAFRVPTTERCFETDVLAPAESGPIELSAAANEYESVQLALAARGDETKTYAVTVTPLTSGTSQVQIDPDRVSRFLYAETSVPSGYDSLLPVGRYPDALLETTSIEVARGVTAPLYVTYYVKPGTPPGLYRGEIQLTDTGTTRRIPITMRVWNIELPVRPFLDIVASTKAGKSDVAPIYMKYKATPSPLPAPVTKLLLAGEFSQVEALMRELIAQGISRVYLGNTQSLLKSVAPERLRQIDEFLNQRGWRDYFYVRIGFDEASVDKVPEMRAESLRWKAVSAIPTMENYYYDSPELFGCLDIISRPYTRAPWVKQRVAAGDRFWRNNAFPSKLENDGAKPWVQFLQMIDYGFSGTYIWTLTAWREIEWGKDWWSDDGAGNLSATLIWPDKSGLLPTIRLEGFRDAVEGHALAVMLAQRVKNAPAGADPALLQRAESLLTGTPLWRRISSGRDIEALRQEIGDVLSALNDAAQ